MKRRFFITMLLVSCIFVGSLSQIKTEAAESAKDSYNDTYLINAPYQYPIIPGTEEWKNLESMPEKIEVSHVDPEVLSKMTTTALVETVVTYPLFVCVHAYDTLAIGVKEVSEYFKGIEELCGRDDAREEILKYINARCPGLAEMKTDEEISGALSKYIKAYEVSGDREVFYLDNAVTLIDYLNCLSNSKEQPTRYFTTYVYTPVGSFVPATYGYTIFDHTTPTNAQIRNNNYKTSFPNAVELDTINPEYNCHSYAWHQQSTSNHYWIESNAASLYMTDGSYISTTAAVGRKIVYKNSSGSPGHSGVISAISDTVYVTSKWDYCGLFYHKYMDCPYYSSNSNISYWKLNQ